MRRFKFLEQQPVSTLEALLAKIKQMRVQATDQKLGTVWYFRGDTELDLKPHLGRPRKFGGKTATLTPEQERKLLHRFRRFAYSEFNRVATEWEALFLARHYGLPTRIMDWTSSPLVALYFACSPRKEHLASGTVWGILRQKDDTNDLNIFKSRNPLRLYRPDPNATEAIRLVYPVYNSGRIVAQKGIFTWHSDPYTAVEKQADQDFDDDKLDIQWLVKWPVEFDPHSRTAMIQELEQLGISSRTIFPDLEGITAGLWQSEVLFSGV